MIKRLGRSLTLKLFAITALLLALACLSTYIVIALSLPSGYTLSVTTQLLEDLDILTEQLQEIQLKDSGPLLRDFQLETGATLEIWDENGNSVTVTQAHDDVRYIYNGLYVAVTESSRQDDPPTEDSITVYSVDVAEDTRALAPGGVTSEAEMQSDAVDGDSASSGVRAARQLGTGEISVSSAVISGAEEASIRQSVWFAGDNTAYSLFVKPGPQPINYAMDGLRNTLPALALAVLAVSLLGALLLSLFVTRPIIRLSAISKRLAELDFDWALATRRTDEIGVLAQSLQTLSVRLWDALEKLKGEVAHEKELKRQRDAFFSAVSHELKTPLTVIEGQLEGMIANVGVYRDRDTYLQRTLDTARQMNAMVQDIMRVFRMEREDFSPHMAPLDLARLARDVAAAHAPLFESEQVSLTVDAPGTAQVTGDTAMLRQVLSNLLANAARYAPAGHTATLRVWTHAGTVRLTLENTGVHIPNDALPHLFDAFYRVEASRSRQLGGSGLGLHIVRTVLDQHGAVYAIQNTTDGVRFRMEMPQIHTETT